MATCRLQVRRRVLMLQLMLVMVLLLLRLVRMLLWRWWLFLGTLMIADAVSTRFLFVPKKKGKKTCR